MKRRHLLGGLAALLPGELLLANQPDRGKLVIVGGAEKRRKDRLILRSFIEHAGGVSARVRLLVAATSRPADAAESYIRAFADLGVKDCDALPVIDRASAFLPAVSKSILEANAVFITGGDQVRLMTTLWETPALAALHQAHHLQGCCIGGTSAGAAAMSRHMIADGAAVHRPRRGAVETDIGLGLLTTAIVDQHFSERRRLARLLSALAHRPDLLGVGVDENTALVIEGEKGIEVVGTGVVTLVDPSNARTNINVLQDNGLLELLGLRLHTLPAGHSYQVKGAAEGADWPAELLKAVQRLVQPGPVRL